MIQIVITLSLLLGMYQKFMHFHSEIRFMQALFSQYVCKSQRSDLEVFQKAISLDNHQKYMLNDFPSRAFP